MADVCKCSLWLISPSFDSQPLGEDAPILQITWVDIENPDPNIFGRPAESVFQQGYDAGGASFRRLEGCWYGDGKIFFLSTRQSQVR